MFVCTILIFYIIPCISCCITSCYHIVHVCFTFVYMCQCLYHIISHYCYLHDIWYTGLCFNVLIKLFYLSYHMVICWIVVRCSSPVDIVWSTFECYVSIVKSLRIISFSVGFWCTIPLYILFACIVSYYFELFDNSVLFYCIPFSLFYCIPCYSVLFYFS